MVKFIAGLLLGLFIGLTAIVAAQQAGSSTGATAPSSLAIGLDAVITSTQPTDFVFAGTGRQELLRIHRDGRVVFQGRLLGTDKEVWDGLRAVMNPWRVCQEIEEDMRWAKP